MLFAKDKITGERYKLPYEKVVVYVHSKFSTYVNL